MRQSSSERSIQLLREKLSRMNYAIVEEQGPVWTIQDARKPCKPAARIKVEARRGLAADYEIL